MTLNSPPSPRPFRILVVDDERDNRELLEVILGSEGFVVSTAASGAEALESLAGEPADLVLLDIMMPGMNGYEVVEKMKGNDATKGIPVIMVTALEDRNARARAASAGADDFLRKPLDLSVLMARVESLLPTT